MKHLLKFSYKGRAYSIHLTVAVFPADMNYTLKILEEDGMAR